MYENSMLNERFWEREDDRDYDAEAYHQRKKLMEGPMETEKELTGRGYTFKNKGVCRAEKCKAEIEWWETPRGKMQPRDAGTLEPHWDTCKDADSFKKKA